MMPTEQRSWESQTWIRSLPEEEEQEEDAEGVTLLGRHKEMFSDSQKLSRRDWDWDWSWFSLLFLSQF
jgi:hypothetical protein